jgi:hypothetical protein
MRNPIPLPPLERLNELLEVVEIPEDKFGEWSGLVWKVSRGGTARVGSRAGRLMRRKNRPERLDWQAEVDGVAYYVSRVIYYMTYGEDPGDAEVDHKDQNPLNNNAWNLRLDADGGIQGVNRGIYRNNTSGVVGVYWYKKTRKWRAAVQSESKLKQLGMFTCKLEAARVVNEKWIELGWPEKGRKLNDLKTIACDCGKCSARDDSPT